jgi:hypothetical protein
VLTPTANCISSIAAPLSPSLLRIFASSLLRSTRIFLFSLSFCLLFYFSSILSYILFLLQVYVPTLSPLYLTFCYVYFPSLTCFSLLFQSTSHFLSKSTIDPAVTDDNFGFASFQTCTSFRRSLHKVYERKARVCTHTHTHTITRFPNTRVSFYKSVLTLRITRTNFWGGCETSAVLELQYP